MLADRFDFFTFQRFQKPLAGSAFCLEEFGKTCLIPLFQKQQIMHQNT